MSESTSEEITFACSCGARLRARASLAGHKGRCKHCEQIIVIPDFCSAGRNGTATKGHPPTNGLAHTDAVIAIEEMCSICQCPIDIGEHRTLCSVCGLPFHEECWRENLGCSAYGCSNVNVLRSGPDIRINELPLATGHPPLLRRRVVVAAPSQHDDGMPWEYLFLAAAVLGSLLGMVTFGLPPVLVAIGMGIYLGTSQRRPNVAVAVISLVICGFGLIVGVIVSQSIWSG